MPTETDTKADEAKVELEAPETEEQDKPETDDKDAQEAKDTKDTESTEGDDTDDSDADKTDEDEPDKEEQDDDQSDDEADPVDDKTVIEALKAFEADSSYERNRLKRHEDQLNTELSRIQSGLPSFDEWNLRIDGEPFNPYEANDKDFKAVVRGIYRHDGLEEKDKITLIERMEDARDSYKAKVAEFSAISEKVSGDTVKLWNSEWTSVERSFFKQNPALKQYKDDIAAAIDKEVNGEYADSEKKMSKAEVKFLIEDLKSGPVAKYKYTLELVNRLGLGKKLEKDQLEKERADLAMSRKGTSSKSVKEKVFTRAEINKMPMDEFLKHEKQIDAQLAAGKIK